MSNVLPFRRSPAAERGRPCVAAVADDLLGVIDQLQEIAGRAAATGRPALEIERTVQSLLDAVRAVERAVDGIGEGGASRPA